jgi:hypothetical protein
MIQPSNPADGGRRGGSRLRRRRSFGAHLAAPLAPAGAAEAG